jgi:hypothetical protein
MRVATRELQGDAEAWDPGNPAPFLALAGSRVIRVEGETAVVTSNGAPEGTEMTVYPGWLAVRADGSGDGEALFATPESIGEPFGPWETVS